uniref:Dipeptidylpeptidase 6 n=1 Tax=Mus musculus TaxID=10090 RepID=D6RFR3_MOUSE
MTTAKEPSASGKSVQQQDQMRYNQRPHCSDFPSMEDYTLN